MDEFKEIMEEEMEVTMEGLVESGSGVGLKRRMGLQMQNSSDTEQSGTRCV